MSFRWVLLGVVIIFDLVQNSVLENTFNRGMDRAFSYISSSGIDMAQTSNRDIVFELYKRILRQIDILVMESFILLVHLDILNIFLEILEGGGIFYFAFWIIILIISIRRAYFIIKNRTKSLFLSTLVSISVCKSLFSGSYLTDWVCFGLFLYSF